MEDLFRQWAKEPAIKKTRIAANGSNRQYYRLEGERYACVAAVNNDVRENEAFFYFADLLRKHHVLVPKVYAVSKDRTIYLQEDLGNNTLFAYLQSKAASGIDTSDETIAYYKRVLTDLLKIQQVSKSYTVNYSLAYPRPAMDRQALQWDFNYFKYNFLKLLHIPFDEQLLEDDFQQLEDYLLKDDNSFLVYRDFQSRNIMLTPSGKLFYIDFQGARQGSPFYDVASLLYSSKSNLTTSQRNILLEYYLDGFLHRFPHAGDNPSDASEATGKAGRPSRVARRENLRNRYHMWVIARMLQTMGTYGYRGIYEGKDYFLRSIPLVLHNLKQVLSGHPLPLALPELQKTWNCLFRLPEYQYYENGLTVRVFSFSYRKGLPQDKSGNGGGYVFDCRSLPNPGRYPMYLSRTGCDDDVVDFFNADDHLPSMQNYLNHAYDMVDHHVEYFLQRKFTNLMVNFGCTGGRHRSVYCAEQMAVHLRERFPDVRVVLRHLEHPELNRYE